MNEIKETDQTTAYTHLESHFVNGVNVDQIVDVFESLGYECKVNSELKGASGIKHQFDIVVLTGEGKGRYTGPTTVTFEGSGTLMTQSKRLSSFNSNLSIEGTADNATGEATLKAYSK